MNSKELLEHVLFSANRELRSIVGLSHDEAASIIDELGEQEKCIYRLREELAVIKANKHGYAALAAEHTFLLRGCE